MLTPNLLDTASAPVHDAGSVKVRDMSRIGDWDYPDLGMRQRRERNRDAANPLASRGKAESTVVALDGYSFSGESILSCMRIIFATPNLSDLSGQYESSSFTA